MDRNLLSIIATRRRQRRSLQTEGDEYKYRRSEPMGPTHGKRDMAGKTVGRVGLEPKERQIMSSTLVRNTGLPSNNASRDMLPGEPQGSARPAR
jgi:hypothetical protein